MYRCALHPEMSLPGWGPVTLTLARGLRRQLPTRDPAHFLLKVLLGRNMHEHGHWHGYRCSPPHPPQCKPSCTELAAAVRSVSGHCIGAYCTGACCTGA